MKNYKTFTNYPVRMNDLRYILSGNKNKLPKDFNLEGKEVLIPTGIYSTLESFLGKVKVIPAIKQGVPRIFILNKNNGKWIPAGRTAQAKFC